MSVRQHRFFNGHSEHGTTQFAFIDGDSDGTARIFLPRGHFLSGDWTSPPRPADLLAYRVADHLPPVNLPHWLCAQQARSDRGELQHPVDLVLLKIDDHRLLITTHDRGSAVIERVRRDDGHWGYRYTPVTAVAPTPDGEITWQPNRDAAIDPLGIAPRVSQPFLDGAHDEQTWLWITATSDYPDSVVVLARHMLWQEHLAPQEADTAPDLVVTARAGWLFGTRNTPGTTHGYPLATSMRAAWYVAGPNIRRGARVSSPCRLVDLTPTLLEMTGLPHDPVHFDGRALRSIYHTDPLHVANTDVPLYWSDVDLRAWQALAYTPRQQFDHQPWSINDPNSLWDVNNLTYNVLAIGDWSAFRMFDDVISPLVPGRTHVNQAIERVDQRVAHQDREWVADGFQALDVPGVALADYSLTSLGNLKRADHAVDWLQNRSSRLDGRLAEPIGKQSVLGTRAANRAIDTAQNGFWELYRFTQRVLVEVLDDVVLNGVENSVDASLNYFRRTPAEIRTPQEPAP